MPQFDCFRINAGAERTRRRRRRGRTRADARCRRASARPATLQRPSAWRLSTAVERNSIVRPLQDLVVDRLLDVLLVLLDRAPASRRHPRARGAMLASALNTMLVCAGSSPTSSVACQAVTRIRRSCPAMAAAPARPVLTQRVPFSGPNSCVTRLDRHGKVAPSPSSWNTPSPPRSRSTRASRRSSTSSAWCRASRARPSSRRPARSSVKAEIDIKMGAMSLKFTGTVEVVEQDADAHRVEMSVRSREAGGQGHADADIVFALARRRRDDPHQRADHGQGGVDGRGSRDRRAGRADQGLRRQARQDLSPDAADRSIPRRR